MFHVLAVTGLLILLRKSPPSPIGRDPQGNYAFYAKSTYDNRPNYVDGIYSGQKYECVEYTRRWFIKQHGVTFPSVDNALSLLELSYMTDGRKRYPFVKVDHQDPRVGDVAIFRASKENSGYGHVAVVVKVQDGRAYIGEQNYSSKKWEGDYSRSIPIENGMLSDKEIIGVRRLVK